MMGKAVGPDGWAAEELLLLPTAFWELLADILQANEDLLGLDWPASLLYALIALIPKGEGADPIKQRPITVFAVVYRLYAGVRYDDTDEWQESWMPKGVYGARRGVEALDATWDMALDIEES